MEVHPESLPAEEGPHLNELSDSDKIRLLGVTCDSQLNTWRAYDLSKDMDDISPKRLDYVFVNPDRSAVRDCQVVFTEPISGLKCSYSDHFGIEVKLELRNVPNMGSEDATSGERTLSPIIFDTIESVTERYIKREIWHSNLRIGHFVVSVLMFIALLIGQWWVEPKYGHFLISLGAVIIMVTGTIDFLIGFIFGRWEDRALKEFISEVRLARKVYLGDLFRE